MRNIRIGDFLVEQKLITADQLNEVLEAQKEQQGNKRFGELVVEKGFITEVTLAKALAASCVFPTLILATSRSMKKLSARSRSHWRRSIPLSRSTFRAAV